MDVLIMPQQDFEQFAQSNGSIFWFARDFMSFIGYQSWSSFRQVINKAVSVCMTLGIPVDENFKMQRRTIDGADVEDFKLSRFACYLVAMNGDIKKPSVAAAQAYFVTLAEATRRCLEEAESVERVHARGEFTTEEKSLSAVASRSGVECYPYFQNAGYRGMYNMDLRKIRTLKGVPEGRSPLDFMGSEELAANLFRITQTRAKIERDGARGQRSLEAAAHSVGAEVRKAIVSIGGTPPEQLPAARDIRQVHTQIKATNRKFRKMDAPVSPRRLKTKPEDE